VLTLDSFPRPVKIILSHEPHVGFKYFIAAAGMPKDCLGLRTKLQIEYHRLLTWSDAAGLIEAEYGQELPEVLKADKLVMVAVLTQVKILMEEFATQNGRYEQLKILETPAQKQEALETNVREEFASIAVKYEKSAKKRRHARGTNHLIAMGKNIMDVVTEPKRLRWVVFDEGVFKDLLRQLTEYNNYLHELMQGHHARKLEEMTRSTFVEMVQVRSTVEELKWLVTASMIRGVGGVLSAHGDSARERNDDILQSLATFKRSSIATDDPKAEKPPQYEDIIVSARKPYTSINYEEPSSDNPAAGVQLHERCVAKLISSDGHNLEQKHVWIEWKAYATRLDRKRDRQIPLEQNVRRVTELVTLLQMPKPAEFRIPKCLGYFDDRDDTEESDHKPRFGLIFEKPNAYQETPPPVTLLYAISTLECPSLADRIAIAHEVASSLLYLHAVRWLHKGIRPDSIIFFREASPFKAASYVKYTEPYLTGFEYARPERDGTSTTSGQTSNYYELYRHPSYQGISAQGNYRKTFDIYSLGILLLEIAAWEPIQDIIGMEDYEKRTAVELEAIPKIILASSSSILKNLEKVMGREYRIAVESCIKGSSALGLDLGDDENDVVVGAKLQSEFTEKVLGALGGIVALKRNSFSVT
jgi:hypothetical protein